MSTDLTAVRERTYLRSGMLSSIPYFAEGPHGYGDCPALAALGVSRYMCRAQGVKDSIVRTYAGLVPLSDPRASAHRRYVAGIGELAYMKGSYAAYKPQFTAILAGLNGLHIWHKDDMTLAKRIEGHDAHNLYLKIRSSGGKGFVRNMSAAGVIEMDTIQFNAPVGETQTYEKWYLADTGSVIVKWQTEFWGSTPECTVGYPGDTPV